MQKYNAYLNQKWVSDFWLRCALLLLFGGTCYAELSCFSLFANIRGVSISGKTARQIDIPNVKQAKINKEKLDEALAFYKNELDESRPGYISWAITQPKSREEGAALAMAMMHKLSPVEAAKLTDRLSNKDLYQLGKILQNVDFKNGFTQPQGRVWVKKMIDVMTPNPDTWKNYFKFFGGGRGYRKGVKELRLHDVEAMAYKKGLFDLLDEMNVYRSPGIKDALKASVRYTKFALSKTMEAVGLTLNTLALMAGQFPPYFPKIGFTNLALKAKVEKIAARILEKGINADDPELVALFKLYPHSDQAQSLLARTYTLVSIPAVAYVAYAKNIEEAEKRADELMNNEVSTLQNAIHQSEEEKTWDKVDVYLYSMAQSLNGNFDYDTKTKEGRELNQVLKENLSHHFKRKIETDEEIGKILDEFTDRLNTGKTKIREAGAPEEPSEAPAGEK